MLLIKGQDDLRSCDVCVCLFHFHCFRFWLLEKTDVGLVLVQDHTGMENKQTKKGESVASQCTLGPSERNPSFIPHNHATQ